ncbi:MAG: DUF444 family protein [Ignavibacteria bacterium]|nr:DUF444 family protein [Ignavibacteria bacterium]
MKDKNLPHGGDSERKTPEDIFNFAVLDTIHVPGIYSYNDQKTIVGLQAGALTTGHMYDLDRLLERDRLREKDGFPRKIRLGKLVKPSRDGGDKSIIIPSASEEKLYHWKSEEQFTEGPSTGGSGDEAEGDVIGEQPIREGESGGQGPGQGEGGEHGMGTDAFEIGRVLTEQFELPNIKDKGKKVSLTRFTYELSDMNRGHGQILDKKQTLRRVVKTNMVLGNIVPEQEIDMSKLIITPADRVYRTLSKEKERESQAMVFFVRDYSGSMQGKPTEAVVTQHVYIHSWLVFQYQRRVISRFIVHDTEAHEVPDFYTYYIKQVAGGTDIASGYALVNKIIKEENLARDFNIYVFHGTDGDDFDSNGYKTLDELKIMLPSINRIGITIAENSWTTHGNSVVSGYLKKSALVQKHTELIHYDAFKADEADDKRLIQSIKTLIS